MDSKQRLMDLLSKTNFKVRGSGASVEELKEIARHNHGEYARIQATGRQHEERLLDLTCLVLAEKLHSLAID